MCYLRSSNSFRADSKPQYLSVNTTAGCPITVEGWKKESIFKVQLGV